MERHGAGPAARLVKVDRGVVRIAELQAQGYAYLQP
jgi:intracellular sulfur oxidation DsrE/DsrF family protein